MVLKKHRLFLVRSATVRTVANGYYTIPCLSYLDFGVTSLFGTEKRRRDQFEEVPRGPADGEQTREDQPWDL